MNLSLWVQKTRGCQADPTGGFVLNERLGPGFLFGCSLEISVQLGEPRDFPGMKRLPPLRPRTGRALIRGDPENSSRGTRGGQMADRGQPCTLSGEAERLVWGAPRLQECNRLFFCARECLFLLPVWTGDAEGGASAPTVPFHCSVVVEVSMIPPSPGMEVGTWRGGLDAGCLDGCEPGSAFSLCDSGLSSAEPV